MRDLRRPARLLILALLVGGGGRGLAMAQGKAVREGAMDAIGAVAVSPDGRWLAGGGRDAAVRLWDARTGTPGRILPGHGAPVAAVAFSPDGRLLASCDRGSRVILWDVASGDRARTLEGREPREFTALAFAHDGPTLAAATRAGGVLVWDVRTGEARDLVGEDGFPVHAIAFSPTDALIAGACGDGSARLWDPRGGRLRRTLRHPLAVRSLAFVAGAGLATACEDGGARLWDIRTGTLRTLLMREPLPVRCLAASPDGRLVAAPAGDHRRLRLWRMPEAVEAGVAPTSPVPLSCLALSADHRLVVGGGGLGTQAIGVVTAWDAATGAVAWDATGHLRPVVSVCVSPDGTTIAGGLADYHRVEGGYAEWGRVRRWEARTGRELGPLAVADPRTLAGSGNWVRSVAFAPDGSAIAVARDDHTIQLWEIRSGRPRAAWQAADAVACLAFAPDGKVMASGDRGGEVVVRDAETGEVRWRQAVPHTSISALSFSPDGSMLASGDLELRHTTPGPGKIILRDARTGATRQALGGGQMGVGAVAFAPDGGTIGATFRDGSLCLWDTGTGELRWSLRGHPPGRVTAVAFSPDGGLMATASLRGPIQPERPGEVKFWNPRTGAPGRAVKTDAEPALSAAFSPGLTTLVIGRDDGTVTRVPLSEEGGRGPDKS